MKRLIKQSVMNIENFKGSLNQLSNEGRNILKLIEDYKFKLDQTCRITSNDKELTKKLLQKRKQMDMASSQIYSIVFDIDNIDITNEYKDQQFNGETISPNKGTKDKKNEESKKEPENKEESSKEESKDDTEEKESKEKSKEESKDDTSKEESEINEEKEDKDED